eukprot:Skav220705  [mRNA]  locus=scaffold472:901463:904572:+ [translate_table: standard]
MSRPAVRRPSLAIVAALGLWAIHSSVSFTLPVGQPRRSGIRRAAMGFGADAQSSSRKRKPVNREDLKSDHGPKAQAIEKILRGGAAESPEDMVRARFSACRSKDAVFMAKTEEDALKAKMSNRVKAWNICSAWEHTNNRNTCLQQVESVSRDEYLAVSSPPDSRG